MPLAFEAFFRALAHCALTSVYNGEDPSSLNYHVLDLVRSLEPEFRTIFLTLNQIEFTYVGSAITILVFTCFLHSKCKRKTNEHICK